MLSQSCPAVLQWLQASSSILKLHDKLSSREYDSFQHQINGLPSQASPIDWLLRQDSEFLEILTLWYGPTGVGTNLVRFGLCSQLNTWVDILKSWEASTIQLAKQHFNRFVNIGDKGGFDSTQLLSSILEDLARTLHETRKNWESYQTKLQTLHPQTLAQPSELEFQIDEEIAQAIGLNSPLTRPLPLSLENSFRQKISLDLQTIVHWIESFFLEVTGSSSDIYWAEVTMNNEKILSHAHRLAHLKIPTHSHLTQWDMCRHQIDEVSLHITQSLSKLSSSFQYALNQHMPKILEKEDLPGSIQRRIAFDHIVQGVSPKTATEAISKLKDYIENNSTLTQDLLQNELPMIHPELQIETLRHIEELKLEHKTGKLEKRRILDSFKKMMEVSLCFIFMISFTGCGVKTLPVNETIEPRPEIPWKESVPQKFRLKAEPQLNTPLDSTSIKP